MRGSSEPYCKKNSISCGENFPDDFGKSPKLSGKQKDHITGEGSHSSHQQSPLARVNFPDRKAKEKRKGILRFFQKVVRGIGEIISMR